MASFLDLKPDDRQIYVAQMMGLSPNHPDTWPVEVIDRVISEAEKAAERMLQDVVRRLCSRT